MPAVGEGLPLGLILYQNLEINHILSFASGQISKKCMCSVSIAIETNMTTGMCGRQAFGETDFLVKKGNPEKVCFSKANGNPVRLTHGPCVPTSQVD